MGDLGSEGASITLGPGSTLSFGDVTALAGDYLESVEQMKTLAGIPGSPSEPYSVQGSVDEIKYALAQAVLREEARRGRVARRRAHG